MVNSDFEIVADADAAISLDYWYNWCGPVSKLYRLDDTSSLKPLQLLVIFSFERVGDCTWLAKPRLSCCVHKNLGRCCFNLAKLLLEDTTVVLQ